MKMTLLGSLGNINRHSIPTLIADGHEVNVVTSNPERLAAIEELGARALVGSMRDLNFLTASFTGQDIVYLMISGHPAGDLMAATKAQAKIFATAVKNSGVKKVVNLSSIGAQNPESGILYMYHYIEEALSELDLESLAIIRPVGFYSNLYGDLASLKAQGKIFSNVPADVQRAWVDPSDIASLQLDFLEHPQAGKRIKYVVSDFASGQDWLKALAENAIAADYQLISDEQAKQGLIATGFSEENAEQFAKMSAAQRQAEPFYADIEKVGFLQGKVKLRDFAKIFAKVYKGAQ